MGKIYFEQNVNPFSFYWIFALRFCACISVLTVLFSESEFHVKLCLAYMYKDNITDQLPGSVSYKKSTDKIEGIMKHMFSWHFLTPTRFSMQAAVAS